MLLITLLDTLTTEFFSVLFTTEKPAGGGCEPGCPGSSDTVMQRVYKGPPGLRIKGGHSLSKAILVC